MKGIAMENAKTIGTGATLSELLEVPPEVKELVASVASAALEAGRAAEAEKVLEGLVAVHPRDPASWALLARAHLRTGKALAARFAAEVGRQLAPDDPGVRLAHAEVLLGGGEGRGAAVEELRSLRGVEGAVGARATALLLALGEPGGV
jgi:predicted Zn-dependent protease